MGLKNSKPINDKKYVPPPPNPIEIRKEKCLKSIFQFNIDPKEYNEIIIDFVELGLKVDYKYFYNHKFRRYNRATHFYKNFLTFINYFKPLPAIIINKKNFYTIEIITCEEYNQLVDMGYLTIHNIFNENTLSKCILNTNPIKYVFNSMYEKEKTPSKLLQTIDRFLNNKILELHDFKFIPKFWTLEELFYSRGFLLSHSIYYKNEVISYGKLSNKNNILNNIEFLMDHKVYPNKQALMRISAFNKVLNKENFSRIAIRSMISFSETELLELINKKKIKNPEDIYHKTTKEMIKLQISMNIIYNPVYSIPREELIDVIYDNLRVINKTKYTYLKKVMKQNNITLNFKTLIKKKISITDLILKLINDHQLILTREEIYNYIIEPNKFYLPNQYLYGFKYILIYEPTDKIIQYVSTMRGFYTIKKELVLLLNRMTDEPAPKTIVTRFFH